MHRCAVSLRAASYHDQLGHSGAMNLSNRHNDDKSAEDGGPGLIPSFVLGESVWVTKSWTQLEPSDFCAKHSGCYSAVTERVNSYL